MNAYPLPSILFLYGSFLILCGIVAVTFIGMKAKTALISGGTAGFTAILIAWLAWKGYDAAPVAGILVSFGLLIVFSWRATKTLFSVFEFIQQNHPDLKGKGIAFLIIALMAVVSLMVLATQLVLASKCCGTGTTCPV